MRDKIHFLRERCHLLDLALRNIESLVDVAPRDILENQLNEVERQIVCGHAATGQTYTGFARPSYVYTLELEGDEEHDSYYYVGMTENFAKRMNDHFSGHAAEWTKLHKPVAILEVIEGGKTEERSKTVDMMKRHGWMTTRGYCWTSRVMQGPPRDLS